MNKWILIAVVVIAGYFVWAKFGSKIRGVVKSAVPGS